jgi:ubiquinone/menaquinone biosynthesis C-methylase UbiE
MSNRTCPWWLGHAIDNPLRRLINNPDKILSPYVRNGMSTADLGCGRGMFSLAMAKIVGAGGRVYSVDLQPEMLNALRKRAEKAGVIDRIRLVPADPDNIRITDPVDFVLAFWMVHEVRDQRKFFDQVAAVLKQGGLFLIAEPKMHVSPPQFRDTLDIAQKAGYAVMDSPSIRISWAVVLQKK